MRITRGGIVETWAIMGGLLVSQPVTIPPSYTWIELESPNYIAGSYLE